MQSNPKEVENNNRNSQNLIIPREENKSPIVSSQASNIEFISSYHNNNKSARIPISVYLKSYRYQPQEE